MAPNVLFLSITVALFCQTKAFLIPSGQSTAACKTVGDCSRHGIYCGSHYTHCVDEQCCCGSSQHCAQQAASATTNQPPTSRTGECAVTSDCRHHAPHCGTSGHQPHCIDSRCCCGDTKGCAAEILHSVTTVSHVTKFTVCHSASDCAAHRTSPCNSHGKDWHCIDGHCCCGTRHGCINHNYTTTTPSVTQPTIASIDSVCHSATECSSRYSVCSTPGGSWHCIDEHCCCGTLAECMAGSVTTQSTVTLQQTNHETGVCSGPQACSYLHGSCPENYYPHCVDNRCCCYIHHLGCSNKTLHTSSSRATTLGTVPSLTPRTTEPETTTRTTMKATPKPTTATTTTPKPTTTTTTPPPPTTTTPTTTPTTTTKVWVSVTAT